MSAKRNIVMVMVAIIALAAGYAAAQTMTHEIQQGTVVHVYGNNLVVKMSDGEIKEFDVPDGFMFNVDGRDVTIDELVPGTQLTSIVTTTETPRVVQVTEERNAEIVQRKGRTLIVRDENGKLKMYNEVPEDIIFTSGGKEIPFEALAGGMKVTAVIVHTSVDTITESDIAVMGSAPSVEEPAPAAAPAPAPAPVAAAPVMLPKTASSMPLIGLSGLALLVLALGIAVIRRF